jgi:ATP-dependent Clp protease ATP-binding subunit ClpB
MKQAGHTSDEIIAALEPVFMQAMSPELYNRVEPVVFNALNRETLSKIVLNMLQELKDRVYASKGIFLHCDQTLVDYLVVNGYHPTLGARPLKRLIERDLTTVVAIAILQGKYKTGSTMNVYYDVGTVVVD